MEEIETNKPGELTEAQFCAVSNLQRLRVAGSILRDVMGHEHHGVPGEILALEGEARHLVAIMQEYYTAEVDRHRDHDEHDPYEYNWEPMLAGIRSEKISVRLANIEFARKIREYAMSGGARLGELFVQDPDEGGPAWTIDNTQQFANDEKFVNAVNSSQFTDDVAKL